MKVLLLQAGSIGDIFFTFLVGEIIKKEIPNSKVELMISPAALTLKESFLVDDVLLFQSKLKSAFIIRKRKYDFLIDYEATFKTHVLSFLSGVPNRVAFYRNNREKRLRWIGVYNCMIPYRKTPYSLWDRIELLEALDIDPNKYINTRYLPIIIPASKYINEIKLWLKNKLNDNKFILLFPEGKGTTKRIPFDKQKKLIFPIKEQGYKIVIAVENEFFSKYKEIYKDFSGIYIFSTKNLQLLMALIYIANGIISIEAFPYHAAIMLRRPVFVIDTVRPPWIPPEYKKAVALGKNLECQYCNKRHCPKGDLKCLIYWNEEVVVESLFRLINKS